MIDDLRENPDDLRENLNDLRENLNNLRENLNDVNIENARQERDIEYVKSQINNLFSMGTIIGVAGLIIGFSGYLITSINELNVRVVKLEDTKNKVDNTIGNISSTIQSKSQEVDELISRVDKLTGKENKSILFTTKGWSPYKSLQVTNDEQNQGVIFNGEVTKKGAGYSKESSVEFKNYGGKILSLNIRNSNESTFDGQKMFKLEVNGKPLTPQEQSRINVGDGNYINSGDGTVNFQLPPDVNKIEFVFYNANVKKLKVSATIR